MGVDPVRSTRSVQVKSDEADSKPKPASKRSGPPAKMKDGDIDSPRAGIDQSSPARSTLPGLPSLNDGSSNTIIVAESGPVSEPAVTGSRDSVFTGGSPVIEQAGQPGVTVNEGSGFASDGSGATGRPAPPPNPINPANPATIADGSSNTIAIPETGQNGRRGTGGSRGGGRGGPTITDGSSNTIAIPETGQRADNGANGANGDASSGVEVTQGSGRSFASNEEGEAGSTEQSSEPTITSGAGRSTAAGADEPGTEVG